VGEGVREEERTEGRKENERTMELNRNKQLR
jgi:hypothetical protein